MSGIEYATGRRGLSAYPTEWGTPLGGADSEERVRWVRSNVAARSAFTAHRKLAERDGRLLAYLRARELNARK